MIFAATGPKYHAIACRAAESVRRTNPGLAIDLYTDIPGDVPGIDRVHLLSAPWHRSKIDAMHASRFARTLYLDADLFVTADIGDVFGLLDRFDIALAHDQERNSGHAAVPWRRPFPAAFPQFNSGVIAFRRSPGVLALLDAWRGVVRAEGLERDQPALRELLWASDLRIATLPSEYNFLDLPQLVFLHAAQPAPRIVHHYGIHKAYGARGGRAVATLGEFAGPAVEAAVEALIAGDLDLARRAGQPVRATGGAAKRLIQARLLAGLARDALQRLKGRLTGRLTGRLKSRLKGPAKRRSG